MVLINDKKYACATCIKGHRVSGCTHTDRPLFEVKKKGRPATQCQFCRDKRKGGSGGGSVHTKCACGDLKNQQPSTIPAGMAASYQSAGPTPSPRATETKKGQPGSTPTFPNGLRDVHEMAAAAEALADLGGENSAAAERNLHNLLNPCNCRTTGRCRCCAGKRTRSPPPAASPTRRPSDAHAQVTDSLIEMFKAKATTSGATPPAPLKATSHDAHSGSTTPTNLRNLPHLSMTSSKLASPDHRHHPVHTSPYVHKAKLYSPYSNGQSSPRHGKSRSASVSSASSTPWPSTSVSPRPPPTRLRPLTDMNRFLGAVFHEDGSVVSQVPRSALGLPGIHTFVSAAESGGAKVEPMEMDVDVPVSFPTSEEVVIGACTCGEGCQCAGCATHGNHRSTSPKQHGHDGACGEACSSCFDCGDQVSIPSGVASIEQLIQIAAANVPKPLRTDRGSTLDALDTRILPPAANMSENVARAFGVVQLKPLECCNGRCQCSPGECKCDSECCGCCTECKCADDDGDTIMADGDAPAGDKQPVMAGCCGSGAPATPSRNSQQLQVAPSSGTCSVSTSPINISPTATIGGIRLASSSVGTPPNGNGGSMVRRNSSVSRAKEKEGTSSGAGGRRLSTSSISSQASVQRSVSSSGKATSKSLAINAHQALGAHHRPILPKPTAAIGAGLPRLAPPRPSGGSGSRQPSPVLRSRASSQASSQSSPALGPHMLPHPPEVSIPSSSDDPPVASSQHRDSMTTRMGDMAIGVDDIATALAASDVDFMAYLNSLLSSNDGDQSVANPSFDVSQSSGQPDARLLTAFSGAVPRPEVEPSLGDIQELIAGALAQQGVLQSPQQAPVVPPTSQPAEFNYFFNFPTTTIPSREEQMANYQINSGGPSLPIQQPMPQFAPTTINPLQQFDDNFFFNQYGNGLSLQVPNLQTDSGRRSNSGDISTSTVSSIPDVSLVPPAPVNHPDIIDLSKPLNPSDIDRIMQALMNQQARQAAGTSGAMPPPQPQVSPQPPRSNVGSVSDPDPFQQYMIDPDAAQNTHLQQSALPEHVDRDWLQKAWPNMLGQSAQRE
ncbi:hypothetical protein CspHIS471_0312230 [Cutaneotrichosporon sp. HIS471]|nr:hypothetical protein CspHIS471_0312230 [Cutaneotrichosporon sp. HIS471]